MWTKADVLIDIQCWMLIFVASIMGEIERIHVWVVFYLRVLSLQMLLFHRFEIFPSHFQLTLISIFDFQFNLLRPTKIRIQEACVAHVFFTPHFFPSFLALAVWRLICCMKSDMERLLFSTISHFFYKYRRLASMRIWIKAGVFQ